MTDSILACLPGLVASACAAAMLAAGRAGFLGGRAADAALLGASAVAAAALLAVDAPPGRFLAGQIAVDPFGAGARVLVALGAALAAWTATLDGRRDRHDDPFAWAAFFASLAAALATTAATGLWSAWLSLETMLLAGAFFLHGGRAEAGEQGRLLVDGAAASAFSLLGIALLFALAGEVAFAPLRERLVVALAAPGGRAVVDTAVVLLLAGIARGAGLVPWQAWKPRLAPDLALPAGVWLHAVVPLAAAAPLARLLRTALATAGADGAWQPLPGLGWPDLVSGAALATMAVGHVAALRADSLARMVAWLAVGQSGFVLGGVATLGDAGLAAASLHAAATLPAVAGALASADALRSDPAPAGIEALRGLLRRGFGAAWPGLAFAFFVASLVAIPPLAGHAGREEVFVAMIGAGAPVLALGAAAASATGVLCWIRVVATMLDRPGDVRPVAGAGAEARVFLAALAAATLGLGLAAGAVEVVRRAVVLPFG